MSSDGRRSVKRAAVIGVAGALGAAGAGYAALRAGRALADRRHQPLTAADPELLLPADVVGFEISTRDGGTLHLVERGSGPAIVLLHGATLAASVWSYQLHDLSARHRVIALDLRGHGRSEPGSEGMTIAAMADDLADVLDALELERATLVGHSMGGMAVLRFCRRHPDVLSKRVGAIAIVASAGGISPPLAGWSRLAPFAAGLAVAGHRRLNPSARPIIPDIGAAERVARLVFGVHPRPAQVREAVKLARSMRADRFVSLAPELVGFDERAAFFDLGVPCVIVVGDRDHMTPPAYARALSATLPGSELVIWPGAGHMLMYERRDALDWLLERLSAQAEGDLGATGLVRDPE